MGTGREGTIDRGSPLLGGFDAGDAVRSVAWALRGATLRGAALAAAG
jgi:hypothetical protein